MDGFVLMTLGVAAGSLFCLAFLVCKIIQEEREKKEKAAFAKAFSVRHNKKRYFSVLCIRSQHRFNEQSLAYSEVVISLG